MSWTSRLRRRRGQASPDRSKESEITVTPGTTLVEGVPIPANDPLHAYCLDAGGAIDLKEVGGRLQSPALDALRAVGVRILLPLVSQHDLIGAIALGPRLSDQDYSSDDVRLLSKLAAQAAVSLRVAQLAQQQQVEATRRERIENELRVAGIIQQTLLPKEVPQREGWQFRAHWQPARSVGGDFYDFISMPDGRLVVIIGDVTDKGVPAALVMASTRSILRSAAERFESPGDILRRANDVLCPDIPPKMFATCLVAVLYPDSGRLVYANAGHNAPYRYGPAGVDELRARGMPLGLMPGMEYEVKETVLRSGEMLLLYSDGLVEAHNGEREMFGEPRLKALLSEHAGDPDLIPFLQGALAGFTGEGWEQEDDVTLVLIEHTAVEVPQVIAQFDVVSEMGNEREAMDAVAQAVAPYEMSSIRLERLKTAVAETTMNAIEYGNQDAPDQPVHVTVLAGDGQLRVRISDHGHGPAETPAAPTPDLDAKLAGLQSPRGWGTFLVQTMVDEVHREQDDEHHTVELVMRLQGDEHE